MTLIENSDKAHALVTWQQDKQITLQIFRSH